jgi:hypothetical protein
MRSLHSCNSARSSADSVLAASSSRSRCPFLVSNSRRKSAFRRPSKGMPARSATNLSALGKSQRFTARTNENTSPPSLQRWHRQSRSVKAIVPVELPLQSGQSARLELRTRTPNAQRTWRTVIDRARSAAEGCVAGRPLVALKVATPTLPAPSQSWPQADGHAVRRRRGRCKGSKLVGRFVGTQVVSSKSGCQQSGDRRPKVRRTLSWTRE